MPSVLVISPHLDDAAFSCAEPMRRLRRAGWQVDVATVFTATVAQPTGFALACQTDKGIASDVDYMALRRAEDKEFLRQLDLNCHHMGLAEAPHRGYESAAELFAAAHEDDPAFEQCKFVLGRLVEKLQPRLCVGPLGVGRHVDHRAVVAGMDHAMSNSYQHTRVYYADQPYALRHPDEVETLCAALEEVTPLHFRSEEVTRCEAINAIAAYTTQLDFQYGGEDRMREMQTALMSEGTCLWQQGAPLEFLEPFLASPLFAEET